MQQLDPPFSYDNLCVVLESAPPNIWHDGMEWYEKAHEWCHEFPQSTDQVAAVIAVFSRNTGWGLNLRYAAKFLHGKKIGHFTACLDQANAVLSGVAPLDVLTGMKVRAFYRNIADPSGDEVTIDRHAAAILAGMPTPQYAREFHGASANRHLNRKAVEIYTRAARERGILPMQAQAVSWLQWRSDRGLS